MPVRVQVKDLHVSYPGQVVLEQLNWEMAAGDQVVIAGRSGSGKTSLAKAIAGILQGTGQVDITFDPSSSFVPKAIYISNWYQFTNLEGDRNFYYQQRYNRHQGHDTLTVKAELLHFAQKEGLDFADIEQRIQDFGFENVQESQLIELSSGEHKKLQLIKGLWQKPQLLLIDEPYTGLDKNSRQVLNQWLDELAAEGISMMLISNDQQLPKSSTAISNCMTARLKK